jgi:hypothetical protein
MAAETLVDRYIWFDLVGSEPSDLDHAVLGNGKRRADLGRSFADGRLAVAGSSGQTTVAAPGGELAGRLAGGGQQGIPATKRDGKNTEMKRRTRGNHLGARKGGRGAGGADRRRGRSSGGGAPAVAL